MRNISDYLKNVPLFANLNDTQRGQIGAACRSRTYRGRVHLFYEGDPGGQLYIVVRGGVKIYADSDGASAGTTLALFSEGEVFGEMALLTGGERTASAITIAEETELLLLDQASFHTVLRDSFDLTREVLRTLAVRLMQTNENLVAIAENSSLCRVSKLLLARTDTYTGKLCPPLTQEEIANIVGVRRETVARNLARLEGIGCLRRNRGHILVTDRRTLQRVVQSA